MPFFVNQIQGKYVATGEEFIITLSIDTATAGESSSQVIADHVRDKFQENWNGIRANFTSNVQFDKVTSYERAKTPNTPATEVAESLFSPPLVGTLSGAQLTPETALVVSLLAAAPGRSNRGRFYLPAFSTQVIGSAGVLNEVTRDSVAAWAAAFLGGINQILGTGSTVVIWSRVHASTAAVTRVRVGHQFDMQRRRQNALPESYKEVSVSQI